MNQENILAVLTTYQPTDQVARRALNLGKQCSRVCVVVDNALPKDRTALESLNEIENIDIHFFNEHVGIAKAMNHGARIAISKKFEWCIFFDDDSTVPCDFIDQYISSARGYGQVFRKTIFGASILDADTRSPKLAKKEAVSSFNRPPKLDKLNYKRGLISSSMLIATEALDEVGLMSEKLFIDAVDYEFCFRARKCGYKLAIIENLTFHHSIGNKTKHSFLGFSFYTTNHNAIRRYYYVRNTSYVAFKYFRSEPWYMFAAFRSQFLHILKILIAEPEKNNKLAMIFTGYLDFAKGKYGKYDSERFL